MLDVLLKAASQGRTLAIKPVPFASTHGVEFLPRMELLDALAIALRKKYKTPVLAILSTPGTGKSRLLDCMCDQQVIDFLKEAPRISPAHEGLLSFLEGLGQSQRVNVTFNQGNEGLSPWEIDLGVHAALAIRVLHACYRTGVEDVFPGSHLFHTALDLKRSNGQALSELIVQDILPVVFPGRRCALFIDEVQAIGECLDAETQISFIRHLANALGSLPAVSTSGSIKAIVAGSDPYLLEKGFRVSNTILETICLPPFHSGQAMLYVDRFLAANGPDLHSFWRMTPWLRSVVAALGTIPRLLEHGLYAICEPCNREIGLTRLAALVAGTSYLSTVADVDTRPVITAILVQAKPSDCAAIAKKLVVSGALCEVTGRPYMPPIALYHWANYSSGHLPLLLRNLYDKCSGGMSWDDFEVVANAATAVRMMALRERGHATISLRDLFFLEDEDNCAMTRYLARLKVSLPRHVQLDEATAQFRLPKRVPCLNVLLRNTPAAASADSVMQLSVVGHDQYERVTIAFQDKLVTSKAANISKEPAKVFGPGTGVIDKDLLILVIRSPFPVNATAAYEKESIAAGRPVVLLHGERFNRLFKGIIPTASSCLNTMSQQEIERVLACTAKTAKAVEAGKPWQDVEDLETRVPPQMAGKPWARMVLVARDVQKAGLLFF